MRSRKLLALSAAAVMTVTATSAISMAPAGESNWRGAAGDLPTLRAAVPQEDGINHILVVDLENESFATTFGPSSPAVYLNTVLRPQGQLVDNYYATGHASLDNYVSQISGQAPNGVTKADCSNLASLSPPYTNIVFGYTDVVPGTPDPFPATNPGQVDGQGCVYPSSTPTITDQLDARYPPDPTTHLASWRSYNGDMGNDPARDGGTPDPTGGTDAPIRRSTDWTRPRCLRRPTSTPPGTTRSCTSTRSPTTPPCATPTSSRWASWPTAPPTRPVTWRVI
jgi:hypothetical protein